jgi:hypothetical protein
MALQSSPITIAWRRVHLHTTAKGGTQNQIAITHSVPYHPAHQRSSAVSAEYPDNRSTHLMIRRRGTLTSPAKRLPSTHPPLALLPFGISREPRSLSMRTAPPTAYSQDAPSTCDNQVSRCISQPDVSTCHIDALARCGHHGAATVSAGLGRTFLF